MSHAPETHGLAGYAYLCALIAELQKTEPGIHEHVVKRAIAVRQGE